jgi:hypothetical protein
MLTKRRSAIDDAKRVMPNTDNERPTRAKLRSDNELPMEMKSTTEIADANRDMPQTATAEAMRAKDRNDNEDPPLANCITDNDEPT